MEAVYLGASNLSSLTKESVIERLGEVSEFRRQKVLTHKTDNGMIQSFGAGLLLETMLKRQGVSGAEIKTSQSGKPYIENGIHFNLSHSGKFVVCAMSGSEVGCDTEEIREIKGGALKSAFLPYEREYIGQDSERFYTLWTIKESYIKFLGETISSLRPDRIKTKWVDSYGIEDRSVRFFCGRIDNYVYSVCVKSSRADELILI